MYAFVSTTYAPIMRTTRKKTLNSYNSLFVYWYKVWCSLFHLFLFSLDRRFFFLVVPLVSFAAFWVQHELFCNRNISSHSWTFYAVKLKQKTFNDDGSDERKKKQNQRHSVLPCGDWRVFTFNHSTDQLNWVFTGEREMPVVQIMHVVNVVIVYRHSIKMD